MLLTLMKNEISLASSMMGLSLSVVLLFVQKNTSYKPRCEVDRASDKYIDHVRVMKGNHFVDPYAGSALNLAVHQHDPW